MSLALNGYILPDEIEDFVEAWHASNSKLRKSMSIWEWTSLSTIIYGSQIPMR